jgi:WD40 repeat protein
MPLAHRVVEVIAELDSKRYRYGSGCRIAGRSVITAAHVVADAQRVWIRGTDKVKRQGRLEQGFLGDPNGPGPDRAPDLALITIVDGPDVPALSLAAVDRDGSGDDPVLRGQTVGYPTWAEYRSPSVRDTAHVIGRILALSHLVKGLLTLNVSNSPRPLPPEDEALGKSEWSGMSGAPVLADGHLVGVITDHAPRAGPSALFFTPLTAIDHDPRNPQWGPGVVDPAAWWTQLGAPGRNASQLRRLPRRPTRPTAPYRATVREIHSRCHLLIGREPELTAITEFATGPPGYRWLIGDAWAGKTSLLAEAVTTALPDQIDVVAYFLSQREADADANRFFGAVVPQLAELLDEDPPPPDMDHFRDLWLRAADKIAADDRYLLLVVDGLDEDLRPSVMRSVAACLPARVPERAHVLVSSRHRPDLPTDVPVGHPLLAVDQHQLEPFAGSAELERLALQEIDQLKRHKLARNVLGFLTAAAGPLTIDDLATLTAENDVSIVDHTVAVRRLVDHEAGRSLQHVASRGDVRYQFTHASLLQAAQDNMDLTHPSYRTRIHDWANKWQDAGWPTVASADTQTTPLYLLSEYLTTLASEPNRQQRIAGDIRWSVAAIQILGVDRVLANLEPAAHIAGIGSRANVVCGIIRAQARHLPYPDVMHDPGMTARLLCLHALEVGEHSLAETLQGHLRTLPDPGPIPLWTTRRISTALQFELTRHVSSVAVLTDGRVVTGGSLFSQGRVLVWDPARPGADPLELGRDGPGIGAIAVLPDGRIVTGSGGTYNRNGRLLVWDPDLPGAIPTELGREEGAVASIAVLPDGRIVTRSGRSSSGQNSDARVLIRDPDRPGAVPTELGTHENGVDAMAVLPDGRIVTGNVLINGRVLLWDPHQPGTLPTELGRHKGGMTAMAMLPDGRVVTGSGDGRVTMWDPDQPGAASTELGRHNGDVCAIAILPGGRIVSSTWNRGGRLLVWDPDRPGAVPSELGRDDGGVSAIGVLPNGWVITGGTSISGGQVRVWDPTRPSAAATELGRDEEGAGAIAVLPDGHIVTRGGAFGVGRVLVWHPDQPGTHVTARDRERVGAIGVLADGRIITGGSRIVHDDDASGWVRVWDPSRPGSIPTELGRDEDGVGAIAVLPDGRVVTGGSGLNRGARLLVWQPDHPNSDPVELGRYERGVGAIAVLSDDRIVTSGQHFRNGRVLLWNLNRPGSVPTELGHHEAGVDVVAALPDGRVVTDGGSGMLLWNPAQPGATPTELGRHGTGAGAIGVLPDGRIVTGSIGRFSDGRLLVWDPDQPGSIPTELGREEGGAESIAVLPDGRIVTTNSDEGRIRIRQPSAAATTTSVPCDAWSVVAGCGSGAADVIVRHAHGLALSGWSIL